MAGNIAFARPQFSDLLEGRRQHRLLDVLRRAPRPRGRRAAGRGRGAGGRAAPRASAAARAAPRARSFSRLTSNRALPCARRRQRHQQQGDEDEDLGEHEDRVGGVQDHPDRIQEDDLDVEEDEQHRDHVEADAEAEGARDLASAGRTRTARVLTLFGLLRPERAVERHERCPRRAARGRRRRSLGGSSAARREPVRCYTRLCADVLHSDFPHQQAKIRLLRAAFDPCEALDGHGPPRSPAIAVWSLEPASPGSGAASPGCARRPSVGFWYVLRVAQVAVVVQVLLGAILLCCSAARPPDGLHYVYGVLPLLVSLLAEARPRRRRRARARGLDFESLPGERQRAIALAIVRRETGIMAVSALVIFFLALRAAGTSGGARLSVCRRAAGSGAAIQSGLGIAVAGRPAARRRGASSSRTAPVDDHVVAAVDAGRAARRRPRRRAVEHGDARALASTRRRPTSPRAAPWSRSVRASSLAGRREHVDPEAARPPRPRRACASRGRAQASISGGSSESEATALAVAPAGSPSPSAVTTVTAVGHRRHRARGTRPGSGAGHVSGARKSMMPPRVRAAPHHHRSRLRRPRARRLRQRGDRRRRGRPEPRGRGALRRALLGLPHADGRRGAGLGRTASCATRARTSTSARSLRGRPLRDPQRRLLRRDHAPEHRRRRRGRGGRRVRRRVLGHRGRPPAPHRRALDDSDGDGILPRPDAQPADDGPPCST